VKAFLFLIDWFIPGAATMERSERMLLRNFVATHLLGPIVAEPLGAAVVAADPRPWPVAWAVVAAIHAFWALPFLLRATQNLALCAAASVQMLTALCLYGAFHYGGASSPFLSWLIIALMLGFFYLNRRPSLVLAIFAANFAAFALAYLAWGFPQRIPIAHLETIGWTSIASAAIYMAWMAAYYAIVVTRGSELEREAERHHVTAARLRQAKEAAEKADRERSIFLAKMSHELRTPLNAVIGYSEMLLESAVEDDRPTSRRRDLERINAAGKHLLSLVADVLDITRIERNEIDLKPQRFDLDAFFSSVIATTHHLVVARGNRFVFMVARDEGAFQTVPADVASHGLGEAFTDATKLRQIVINLLSNAAKFTENGVVTLAVRRERRAAGDWVEVQVRDTGVGIAAQAQGTLFQAYAQASPGVAGKFGGTGLGLAISQKLSALMGGGVTLASEPGKGACFTVRVPADWAAAPTPGTVERRMPAAVPA
jgi:signal transduction histidine kinase